MRPRRTPPGTRYSFFDRLEAAFVTVLWLLPPCAFYWLYCNYLLAGTSWQLGGQAYLWVLAGGALLGFGLPRAVPNVVGALWDGIMSLGRFGPW